MRQRQYPTRAEFQDHIKRDWRSAHGIRGGVYDYAELDYSRIKGLTAGSVVFAGATGYLNQDNANFFWDATNKRLGLNLSGSAPNVTLELDGNIRVVGTSYSTIGNYVSAGREILILRGKTNVADGAGINVYGDADSEFAGQIKFITNNTTALSILADQTAVFASTISTASGSTIGNLTLADGSITDSGGSISFGDEHLILTGTIAINRANAVAGGDNAIDAHIIQSDDVTLTGTLRGAYITASNGDNASAGTIRGAEIKARAGYPGETGANVGILEAISASADAKTYTIGTLRGAEIILDGASGASVTLAVGLRIANNFQADIATTSYAIQIYADSFAYDADIIFQNGETIDNIVNGIINVGGKLRVTENSDTVTISHDGASAWIKWSDGALNLATDEGTNTSSYVDIKGKGTGIAYLRIYDENNAEYFYMACSSGVGYIRTAGIAPGELRFQHSVAQNIKFWSSITSGNPYFYIYGYQTGVGVKYGRHQVSTGGIYKIDAEIAGGLYQGGTACAFWYSDHFKLSDNRRLAFGSATGGDYGIGYHEPTDTLQIVNGTTLNASIRYKLDSAGIHYFGDGGVTNYAQIAADGEITLAGTARVARDSWIPFNALKAPGIKPATYGDHGISGAWSFADATDDTVVANIKLPNDMDKSVAPVIAIGWSSTTADPGDDSKQAVWQLEYLYRQAGEDTTAVAQGTLTITVSSSTVTEGLVSSAFAALAVPHANDVCLHIRLKRLGADGNDDLGDVAELHGLCLEYTSNKLGTATT